MADLNLPPNVKQDPNTGLYLITNGQGKTVRVNADTQDQLNQYVNSVNTGTPASVTVTDPNTGNPRTRTFDPGAIISERESINKQNELLTAGKRQAGVIGNRDGSYQDIRTGQTISKEQAEAKIKSAGLPPETLAAVTPKNSPAYAAAQQSIDQTATVPSNIPPADTTQPSQSSGGNSTSAEVTASVPAPEPAPIVAAAEAPADTEDPYTGAGGGRGFVNPPLVEPAPQETPLLTPAESIAQAQTTAPADVAPDNTGIFANPNFSSEAISGAPTPVDPATDSGVKSPFGGSAFNTAAAQNPEAAAQAVQQAQASQEAATKLRAQEQAALQARLGQSANGDWRVRIRLAPNSTYLYKAADATSILAPLTASDGVIFPYTPTISTSYNAEYDATDLTHSNYRGQFYKNSNVGDISINGIFTAQDTVEANYMLAVIHFFRSVTKMFYGQDAERGAPPPLVYLSGYGPYQFNGHPCVVKSFNYSLPNDVDYIRTQPNNYGINLLNRRAKQSIAPANTIGSVVGRLSNAVDLLGNILKKGALPAGAGSSPSGQPGVAQQAVYNTANATYVPTKIEIQLSLMPIQTRNQVSQQFSLKDYANGSLLRGGFW